MSLLRTVRFAGLALIAVAPAAATANTFSNYEDLTEGFLGPTFTHNGVTYRDVNNVSGFYPDGTPFNNTDNGNENILERATVFYNDFPTYGSPVNSMTFGSAFVPGDNLSIGALASVWMDLPGASSAASFDLAFYENGPWGGIEYRLEAVHNGNVVASDNVTISDLGGRDNPTFRHMSISTGGPFEHLHLYGWLNGNYTVPRGMIDNLSVTSVPEPGSVGLLAFATIAPIAARRRR